MTLRKPLSLQTPRLGVRDTTSTMAPGKPAIADDGAPSDLDRSVGRKRSNSDAFSPDSAASTDKKADDKRDRAKRAPKRAPKKAKTPASSRKVEAELGPDLTTKPLSNLREIIKSLLESATPRGLDQYVHANSQFFLRVGTVCSGTDAPLHVLKLFGMLKNDGGRQVFTAINSFACEIEPFKQAFLERNSKPNLLFRDARDFSKNEAEKA